MNRSRRIFAAILLTLAPLAFAQESRSGLVEDTLASRELIAWTWMQKPRNAWIHYILAIHKGKEGHWVLIKGVKLCDTYSEGRWQFVCDGPHKGCRIMEVFEVRKAL